MEQIYPQKAWYVAALPHEIGLQPLRRVILGAPIMLFRSEPGRIIALEDRCPHRFAPLSRGRCLGEHVECGYHGLVFDAEGSCVSNPHGEVITPQLRVRPYPVVERHGLVWIWPGDREEADDGLIPDLGYMTSPGVKTVHSRLEVDYRADILIDNLMDLSHSDYLHVGSFSGGPPERSEMRVVDEMDGVIMVRTQYGAPPPPPFAHLGDRVDLSFRIHWRPGNVMSYEMRCARAGDDLDNGVIARFSHIATPRAETGTHYFMSGTRDYALDDPEIDQQTSQFQLHVIDQEDGPMLYAVDQEMAGQDLLAMRPVILPCDAGALRVRRVLKKLVARENCASGALDNEVAAST